MVTLAALIETDSFFLLLSSSRAVPSTMGGKAWPKAQVRVLRYYLLAGHTDEEIAQLLTSKFPNSPRTVVAIRGKRRHLRLDPRQHLPAKRPSTRTNVKPRFTNEEGDVIITIKDAYPKARWWQIAAAFNICVESHRQRSGDSVKRRYHMTNRAAFERRTRMEFREEILRKVSPFFSTLLASTAKARSQSPDRLLQLGRQHVSSHHHNVDSFILHVCQSFIEKRESAIEEHPVEYSYDATAVPRSPPASIIYPAELQYWTDEIPYYHQSSPYCRPNTGKISENLLPLRVH